MPHVVTDDRGLCWPELTGWSFDKAIKAGITEQTAILFYAAVNFVKIGLI